MTDFEKYKHPNPMFCRNEWMTLNGSWDFAFDEHNCGVAENWFAEQSFDKKINVPFVFQSQLSGINSKEFCDVIWYKKTVDLPADWSNKRIFAHFGAIDYHAFIWVNGIFIGEHMGGYASFKLDITNAIKYDEPNIIAVRVVDRSFDRELCRGKQCWSKSSFGCWYKQYNGIWQDVWLEAVDNVYIQDFTFSPDGEKAELQIDAVISEFENFDDMFLLAEVELDGKQLSKASVKVTGHRIVIKMSIFSEEDPYNGVYWWSPDSPKLYDVKLSLFKNGISCDQVMSYFGIRKLEIRDNRVMLNNAPCYQKLILFQGYYPQGFITASGDEEICKDIQLIKDMGFNGLRIHEKIESARFLYWCDVIGVLVWEEMPSGYRFMEDNNIRFYNNLDECIKRDKNHPSIITWVLFNESWGIKEIAFDKKQQYYTQAAYYMAKSLDTTRIVISNDGWEHTVSDLCTLHDYESSGDEIVKLHIRENMLLEGENNRANLLKMAYANGFTHDGKPIIISEYGGISFESDDGWGYDGKVKDEEEYLKRFKEQTEAFKSIPNVQGYCFTQFTDVETEQNGLLTFDRKPKVPIEKIREINK